MRRTRTKLDRHFDSCQSLWDMVKVKEPRVEKCGIAATDRNEQRRAWRAWFTLLDDVVKGEGDGYCIRRKLCTPLPRLRYPICQGTRLRGP